MADRRVPDREDLLPVSTGNSCLFCGTRDWDWVYLLRQVPPWVGQLGWTIGWQVMMCDRCRQDFSRGEDDELVRALFAHPSSGGIDEAGARLMVRVVRARQSEPPIPWGDAIVSGVGELMAEGFTPIENLTGMLEVAVVWPEEHRRSVPEERGWLLKDEQLQGRLWAVRPPWPGWTLEDVFVYLWSLADQHTDPDSRLRAAADALRWDEPRARRQLELARLKDIE